MPTLPDGIEVYVKTGSMDGVKSYAGYITIGGGQLLTFAIIGNDYDCSNHEASELLTRILQKIVTAY